MNPISDSQADESAYQDAQYYETIDGSLNDNEAEYSAADLEQRPPLREQDRFLPIANVSKIMKRAIPSNGKVAKDAKECVQECVSEFISFITSEAAERCQNEKRKTINGEDLLWAMSSLGFENYVEPLKTFLVKLRDANKIDSSVLNDSGAITSANLIPSHGQTVIVNPTMITSAQMGQTIQHRTLQVQAAPGQLNGIGSATLDMADVKPIPAGGDGDSTDLKPGTVSGMTTITMASASGGPGQTAFLLPYNSGQVQSLISSGQVTIVNGNAVVTSATT